MATMWKSVMNYLGLGPDDEYVDDGVEAAQPASVSAARVAPPEPPEPTVSAVRPLAREPEQAPAPTPPAPRARPGVVRPILPPTASAKPAAVAPDSFNQAQEVADKYLSGTPVTLELKGADRELSRRLVDFSSGLCYGTKGQMERMTSQVYLLTPSGVEVSAEERRRLQERTR